MPAWLSWLGGFWSNSEKKPKPKAERPRKLTFAVKGSRIFACDEDGNSEFVAWSETEWFRQWIDGQAIVDGRKK